ncbi:tail protein [Lactobacillus phage ATCC 8014-B2]|uniref:Tail protein n=1 Tax=Lactobacillus phage ATCC 8014-B2 TaxID=1225795 RepID=K4HZN8_9CAUD|nr:tail protein [Lactobacillus phage ATCC 8014-B2]AFU63096.1 tail protein [Lactobacillus phage ATCC 8014-B2]
MILVNDISRIPSKFGSDDIIADDGTVQVQFFYPLSIDGDVTALYEHPVRNMLRDNGWYQTIGGGIDREPNTSQLYSTYHFKKTIY